MNVVPAPESIFDFMYRYFKLLLLFVFVFSINCVQSQNPKMQALQNNLETLANYFPQEKIYIQFDKPAYTPGETLWFKAYIMAGTEPANISKTVYVDFYDDQGKVLMHGSEPVVQASGNGHFDIPANTKSKQLSVKAYTKWMLNFDSSFLYRKIIPLLSDAAISATAQPENKTGIQFFPESGHLVAGIPGKVAFKAIHSNGLPANVSGTIIDSKGTTAASFSSTHNGMGFFEIAPVAGEKYTAQWKTKDGAYSSTTTLPTVDNSGVTLDVKLNATQRGFVIHRSDDAPAEMKHLYIVGTMQQHLVYMAGVNLDQSNLVGGAVPVANLPSGVMLLTVLDSNFNPLAERTTFVNNGNYGFQPEVGFAELGLGKHGKNTLAISLPDSVLANMSVAITDAGIGKDSSDDIISRLLLADDIKGNVYHPSYYFQNNSDSAQQQLDLVMLTNGWRSIAWKNVVAGKTPPVKYVNDTSYLSFGGKIYGLSDQAARMGTLLLTIIDNPSDTSKRQTLQSTVNSDGSFAEPQFVFFDSLRVYYQVVTPGGGDNSTEVSFNSGALRPLKPSPADSVLNQQQLDIAAAKRNLFLSSEAIRLAKLREGSTLEDVTVTAKVKSPLEKLDERYSSGLFKGGDAVEFDVGNDPFGKSAQSIFTYLQGKVAGLQITNASASGASVSWRGGTPTFYLNETPTDVSMLTNMNVNDIAYVKVFRPPFMGGFNGANGAIAVYTKKGGDVTERPAKGLPYKLVIGYSPQKKFYSPDYGSFTEPNTNNDLRSTLYWNPLILTSSENHVIKMPFYNNDATSSFRVIVEGLTTNGLLIHVEKVIE